ncbi:sulfate ABC transporter ATP-binding protein [Loktanella sp. D2R18]|uniref:ATP-binding cassette domain-containing protein n=1 Tax=Rhodobacterales TaxID=204455 RepID=UPI000DEA0B8F|nr:MULTISPECIES: ATP-binding cassette domain-containing protein [Rhodobacterales]MDO6591519.1 ATP-binding cassette domain-containing protein [Yoonia sp. 1_MG-2023]RBW43846.1 sulfate ABC transporter ATP-binding protein [Loktanella sp. D2R18]
MVTSILPLVMSDAVVKRRAKVLLGPVNLTISQTGFTIVMGPNGAGKTTLLRSLHGLERLAQGRAQWQTPLKDARRRQAFVFQSPIVLRRSVLENLTYPLRLRGTEKGRATALARDWAQRVGLGDALDNPAPQLSGGEKQKLALARALITQPDIVFLDEPCANLDGRATREIEDVLQASNAAGTRIVMATHNIGQAKRLALDVVFLLRGKIVEQSPAGAFFEEPKTPQAAALLRGDIVE